MGSKEETPKKRARFPTGKVCLLHRSWDGTKVMEANGSPFNLRSWTNTSRLVRVRLGVLASPEIGWSDLPGSNNSNGRGRSVAMPVPPRRPVLVLNLIMGEGGSLSLSLLGPRPAPTVSEQLCPLHCLSGAVHCPSIATASILCDPPFYKWSPSSFQLWETSASLPSRWTGTATAR